MRILVTGATGTIGPRVVARLSAGQFSVRTFSAAKQPEGMFPSLQDERVGDIRDPMAVQAAMHGVDAVIHLAALLHVSDPASTKEGEYESINIGGTSVVVQAAIKAAVKRIVFFSTIAVYGPSHGRPVAEDSEPRPDTCYARSKLAAEKIVLDARNSAGDEIGVVLRFSAVYGARIRGNYRRLVKSLAANSFIPLGDGRNRRALIYDKDAAEAAVLALEHGPAGGRVFNVSDGESHSLRSIIAAISQALDRNPPRLSLPAGPVRFASGMIEHLARCAGLTPPITRSAIDKYIEDVVVDSSRIRDELGFAPQYGLLAGWREAVQEMRRAGEL